MTDTLPSSQADSDTPKIFLRPDGTNWQIFVEAGGIPGGFKLRRLLKKVGAAVCSDPRQSEVILVDSSTNEGRLFIRDWGTDDNKVVLEYSWVNGCISEGRVLDGSHNWGGFLTHDDGLPIVKVEPDHIPKSPLPTPRETPEETTTLPLDGQSIQQFVPTSATATPLTTMMQFPNPAAALSTTALNHQYSEMQQISDHIAPSQFPTVQPMIQPGPPPPQAYSMDQVRAMLDFLNQQSDPRLGAQYTPLAVAAAMTGATGAWPWGLLPDQNVPTDPLQMLNSQGHHVDPSSLSTVLSPSISHPAQATHSQYQGVQRSPTLTASTRRKSPAGSLSPSNSRTSKSRAMSSGYTPSSAESSSISRRTNPLQQPCPKNTLFTTETGRQLSFFIQVDLNERRMTMNAIKNNGGITSKDQTTADYAILYSRSSTFKDLCRSARAAGKPAVSAAFVHECVRENTVLDPTPYLFPLPLSPHGKRKWPDIQSNEPSEDKTRAKKSRKKTSQVDQRREMKEVDSPVFKIKHEEEDKSSVLQMTPLDDDWTKHRSPTPPPAHPHVHMAGKGIKYTEQERAYALQYVDVLLERDHQMSTNMIAGKLFRKIPIHPIGSWQSFIVRTIRDDVESIRKRKSIAYRKAQRAAQEHQKTVKTEQSQDQGLDKGISSSSRPLDPVGDQDNARKEQDLQTISRFFATRPEEEEEDDADVWAALTSQATCQTTPSWEEFYTEHHGEVNARFNELIVPMPRNTPAGYN